LCFTREPGFQCLVNISSGPVQLPTGARVLLASADLTTDGAVVPDTAVWLQRNTD